MIEQQPEPTASPIGPSGPPPFALAAFWAFVVGGLVFGAIFLVNWSALGERERPRMVVAAGPVSVRVPMPVQFPGGMSQPAAPAPGSTPKPAPEITTNLADVVKVVLPEWQGRDRVNIILLGVDKREDQPIAETRSDTIMLLSIDPVSKSAALVSLPRDLWVTIPGCTPAYGCISGQQRINVAHAVGGPELVKRTLTADFGIPVQYYARVDFRGFEELVDTIGGVLVDVDQPVKDDEYPTEDYGYQRIYFAPGPQLMDGHRALQFARTRHGSNDFSRARRQQQVLVSLRTRALQLGMISKAPSLMGIVQKSLNTDLSAVELLSLARLVSEIDRERIGQLVIDANYVRPFVGYGGADLLAPNVPAIRRGIDETLRVAARPELKARVEVLNGSATPGLGQRAAEYLRTQGFNVVKIDAAERTDYRSSMVQVLTDDHRAAEALASTLRMPETAISDQPTANAGADIRIVVGQDFLVPTS